MNEVLKEKYEKLKGMGFGEDELKAKFEEFKKVIRDKDKDITEEEIDIIATRRFSSYYRKKIDIIKNSEEVIGILIAMEDLMDWNDIARKSALKAGCEGYFPKNWSDGGEKIPDIPNYSLVGWLHNGNYMVKVIFKEDLAKKIDEYTGPIKIKFKGTKREVGGILEYNVLMVAWEKEASEEEIIKVYNSLHPVSAPEFEGVMPDKYMTLKGDVVTSNNTKNGNTVVEIVAPNDWDGNSVLCFFKSKIDVADGTPDVLIYGKTFENDGAIWLNGYGIYIEPKHRVDTEPIDDIKEIDI